MKNYWVKKNPGGAAGTEWIEMNGKQFYAFINSPAGKDRYFTDFGEYEIEVTREQYREWQSEVDHRRYLQGYEDEVSIYSLDSFAGNSGISYAELIVDLSANVEDEVLKNIDLQALSAALRALPEDERRLIYDLYLRDKPITEIEMSRLTGIPQQTINYRKKKILKKLKDFLVNGKKSSQ